jgi:uncharacterized protein YegL
MAEVLEQVPFSDAEFAENPESRCPCLLLLDNSTSMRGRPIKELNEGLSIFQNELTTDSLASKRVEVAVITFGPVKVQMDFTSALNFTAPKLSVVGDTPMGAAIEEGLGFLRARKDIYRSNGIAFYRPWIFLITDGAPTDSWEHAGAAHKGGRAVQGI